MTAELMVDPGKLGGGDHVMFISGNDITTARGTESYLPLWIRLWGALKTPHFNVKIVR